MIMVYNIVMRKPNPIKDLIKTGRKIVSNGLVVSTGGNISARCGGYMFIKTSKSALDSKKICDYAKVDLSTGKAKLGTPSSEKLMHLACYKSRSDINAVLHLHPVYSTALANSDIKIGPITYELISCVGSEIARASYKPSGSKELASEIGKLTSRFNAVLMPNHGLIVIAPDLNTAFERVLAVERAAQTLIFSKLLGVFKFLPKKEAERIIKIYKK